MQRLEDLIRIGSQLVIRGQVADHPAFYKWRITSLSLLEAEFTKQGLYYSEFARNCNHPHSPDVKAGTGILQGSKDDIESGFESRARSVNIEELPLHPRIAEVCLDLYRDGHFANAVLEASKALINYVKEKSRRDDLDGTPLMRTVFSKNAPILAFNDLGDQSDLDEQEGIMHLFEGAVLAIRNPRGHDFPDDTPERALEYISFISLLANLVQDARRTDA